MRENDHSREHTFRENDDAGGAATARTKYALRGNGSATTVQAIADRYDEFEAADAEVASVLPERADRVADWQDRYDLPFPLLADPSKAVGDQFDQPGSPRGLDSGDRHNMDDLLAAVEDLDAASL